MTSYVPLPIASPNMSTIDIAHEPQGCTETSNESSISTGSPPSFPVSPETPSKNPVYNDSLTTAPVTAHTSLKDKFSSYPSQVTSFPVSETPSRTPLYDDPFATAPLTAQTSRASDDARPVYRLYKRRFLGVFAIVLLNIGASMSFAWFGPIADIGQSIFCFRRRALLLTRFLLLPFLPSPTQYQSSTSSPASRSTRSTGSAI